MITAGFFLGMCKCSGPSLSNGTVYFETADRDAFFTIEFHLLVLFPWSHAFIPLVPFVQSFHCCSCSLHIHPLGVSNRCGGNLAWCFVHPCIPPPPCCCASTWPKLWRQKQDTSNPLAIPELVHCRKRCHGEILEGRRTPNWPWRRRTANADSPEAHG